MQVKGNDIWKRKQLQYTVGKKHFNRKRPSILDVLGVQTMQTATATRPGLMLEDNYEKKIRVVDVACPNEKNIEERKRKKLQKYQQLPFKVS